METVTAPSSTDASHSPPLREPSLDTRTLRRTVLGAVVAFGLMARVLTFQAPLFDLHAWRQADTATVARNFAVERFNPLYPQVDYRGSQPDGYVETGLELYAFIVAGIARVLGFSTESGRLLSAFFFPITALLLHRFIAERYGRDAGLIGLSVYALGLPLTLYIDRAFMNESLLTLLSVGTLRSTQQYPAWRSAMATVVVSARNHLNRGSQADIPNCLGTDCRAVCGAVWYAILLQSRIVAGWNRKSSGPGGVVCSRSFTV